MSSTTPRGGDPKNSGRFSRVWGARRRKIAGYEARARNMRLKATNKKQQDYYRLLELSQGKKLRPLGPAQERQYQRLQWTTQTKAEQRLNTAAVVATVPALIGGAVAPQSPAVGGAMLAGGFVVGEGLALTAAGMSQSRKNRVLGVKGWALDGNLSNQEVAGINAALGAVTLAGIGGLGLWADRRLGGQMSKILSHKLAVRAGWMKLGKNVRPAQRTITAPWKTAIKKDPNFPNFDKYIPYSEMETVEDALSIEMGLRGIDFNRASMAYHGSPLVNPQCRFFQQEAEQVLGLPQTTFAHFQLKFGRSVTSATQVTSYKEAIKMQYDTTQKFLRQRGITGVDVYRGMGLTHADIRRLGVPVLTEVPAPGSTGWVELDTILPPLSSFATSPKMAIQYLTGVTPKRGDVLVITRTRVPRERVYSFAGLGPGHDSEIVITGGETPVQMLAVTRGLIDKIMREKGVDFEDAIGTLWDVVIPVGKRLVLKGTVDKRKGESMSKEIARDKRIQAGLSLSGATLGLAALGTKGGAVATRAALKKAPQAAARLRLTPKGAEAADKASLGLVTTASGVGGASGIHFANLQRKEAKQEETMKLVKKSWDSKVKEADDRRAAAEGRKHHQKMLEQGRFIRVGQEPDTYEAKDIFGRPVLRENEMAGKKHPVQRRLKLVGKPVAPPRRRERDYGGIRLEDRRQRRMKAEQWGAAGVAGASGGILAGQQVKGRVGNYRLERKAKTADARAGDWKNLAETANQQRQQSIRSASRARNLAEGKYAGNSKKQNEFSQKASQRQYKANTAVNVMDRSMKRSQAHAATATALRAKKVRVNTKSAAALAGLTAASAGAAYGIKRMRRGQGKHYSDWWDG